jgi:CubicO group peptidase (beta-lactamase class C family)
MRLTLRVAVMFALVAAPPRGAVGQALPEVRPELVGLSATGMARLDSAMAAYISGKKLPGIVIAVARNGKLAHWKAFGLRSVEANDPMRPDDLFRIMSMTKPITTTAAMMLVEEQKLELDEPVARYIPAFRNVKVWTPDGLVPPHRPMTVRDLMRHTSGLTYGLFGNTPVDSMYRKDDPSNRATSLADLMDRLARLPLVDHPGEAWNYSYSTDVLGRIVEVVSGMPLDRFFEERIFKRLGMRNTFFEVPSQRRPRFVGYYALPAPGRFFLADSPDTGSFTRPPKLFAGGSGLVSSASDYLRFAQMILNGGKLDGTRLLRAETVDEMLKNQIPAGLVPIRVGSNVLEGTGFGFGFSIAVESRDPRLGPVGLAGWGGYANTFFWIDPQNRLIGLILTQFFPFQAYPIESEFRRLVYGAMN